ncbi:sensor histidine kinase [Sporosarcina soli]|uniref:histidine kinase n=1 Tax=Sporosarcina soli TaxID=334736 RepID=A0ABW0TGH6_9BACL
MNINYRMMFQFLTQFILNFIATFLIVVLLIILAMHLITKDELKSNPQKAIVENLPYSSYIGGDGQVELNDSWKSTLSEHQMWVQIIDGTGEVIYAFNTPDHFQRIYTMNDLLAIEKTNQLGNYTVDTYFETGKPQPYYYLFGYIDKQQQLLTDWYDSYSDAGIVRNDRKEDLEKEVSKHEGMLEIYQDGKLVEKIGENLPTPTKMLDVVGSIHVPGNYETKAYVVNDNTANSAWVYHELNDAFKSPSIRFFSNRELQTFALVLLISMVILVVLSIWNGYRYGKPLLLFMNWLKIVEQKQYEDVLSGKEHQKIYKKNGKVKFRYRLYKEVFETFSNMSEKLSLAEQERKQLERTREEWMAGISHDLRTPLSSIQGYGHLLESGQYDYTREELQQIGQVIRDKSDYMVDLVNDFSLIFQLKNSAIAIQKERIDMNAFIHDLVVKYQDDFTLNSHLISFERSDERCEVEIDPKWFIRVLDNLLSNAMKHNPPRTKVHVKVVCKQHTTMIMIMDNGKGMDETFVDHLFTRYYRGTSTDERTEGEGLGMSIAYAIVKLHGGSIEVQSEVGKGTTVVIKL